MTVWKRLYEEGTVIRTREGKFPSRQLELHLTGTVPYTVINKQAPTYKYTTGFFYYFFPVCIHTFIYF